MLRQQITTQGPLKSTFVNLPKVELLAHVPIGIMSPALAKQFIHSHESSAFREILKVDEKRGLTLQKNGRPDKNIATRLFILSKGANKLIEKSGDIQECVYQYLKRSHEEGAIYVELSCSLDCLCMSIHEYIQALTNAIDSARDHFGIEARVLIALSRNQGPTPCQETLRPIFELSHPYIVGINLVGDESDCPAENFIALFKQARHVGLKCIVQNEMETSAEKVREMILTLEPDRLCAPLSCLNELELVEFIKTKNMSLDITPGRDVFFELTPDWKTHPFFQIRDQRIGCSLNTAYPTLFQTSIGNEYRMIQQAGDLSTEDMLNISRSAIRKSFASKPLKEMLLKRIDVYAALQVLCQAFRNQGGTTTAEMQYAISAFAIKPLQKYLIIIERHALAARRKVPDPITESVIKLKQAHKAFEQASVDCVREALAQQSQEKQKTIATTHY